MTADTHEAAVARLREAYAAWPPGIPVRLAKHTTNLFRFRDPGSKTWRAGPPEHRQRPDGTSPRSTTSSKSTRPPGQRGSAA